MIVYLNGEFLPLEEAKISVLDRGFMFADGVYEVIPVYSGQIFRFQQHFQRLENSLTNIKLPNPLTQQQWFDISQTLITRNGDGDQIIYLQITRGTAKRKHTFSHNVVPTVFMMSDPIIPVPRSTGVKAITYADIRWQLCNIKSVALLANVLLSQQAVEVEANEAILIRDGYVTEGATSNVFVVIDGVAITPPKSQFILPGITRDLIIEVMQAAGLPVQEAKVSESQLHAATEIWLCSSTRDILPVITLNNTSVGNGQPGTLWSKVWQIYQDYKQKISTT